MKVLVWQWGRRGAGPRYATELARAFGELAWVQPTLFLSRAAEVLPVAAPPGVATMRTYRSLAGYCARMALSPLLAAQLARWVRRERFDVALCAMPAAMDMVMALALRMARVPYAVVVHDAEMHPGDRYRAQMWLQRRLLGGASLLFVLTEFVAERLRGQRIAQGKRIAPGRLPPFRYGPEPPPPFAHGGARRLLSFGRLLSYKGLDLLADGLELLGGRADLAVRVVGSGPDSADLARLRRLPGVTVENRWVAEDEVGALFAWADGLILSHREASQSGVAAAAFTAGRWVIATDVGGLPEQLRGERRALLCPATADGLAAAIADWLAMPKDAAADGPAPDRGWREGSAAMAAALAGLAGMQAGVG